MKHQALRWLLILAMLGPAARAARVDGDLFQDLDFDAARARAAELDLPLLVELESPDPARTEAFDAEVWSDDKAVRYVEVEVVAVRYGGAESDRLTELYGVKVRPALLLLESDGQELLRLAAPMPAAKFIRNLRLTTSHRAAISETRRAAEAAPEDFDPRLTYARTLAGARLFGAALVEFDRVWSLLRGAETYPKGRLAQVVRSVAGMISHTPKARGTLMRWRKQAVGILASAAVEGAEGTSEESPRPTLSQLKTAASEIGVINSQLDYGDHSMELYEQLLADPAIPAEVSYSLFKRHVFQVLYNRKDYEGILAGCGDVFVRVDKGFELADEYVRREREGELGPDELYLVGALQSSAISRAGIYFEVLLKTGHPEEARALADIVCNRLPIGKTYVELMHAARRCGNRDELRRLGEEGLSRLNGPKDKALIRDILERRN